MRVARIDHDGAPRTAVVGEGTVHLLPSEIGVLDILCVSEAQRAAIAAQSTEQVPLAGARLLAPIEPASLRDFSAFEQHLEGAVMLTGGPDAKVFEEWYKGPACYFSNPHSIAGPDEVICAPPGCEALDLELELAVVIGGRGRDLTPEQAHEYIVGYTIWNDWSARDLGMRELKMPFGFCKAKDFANTLGPWIVTPDELEPYRDGDRLDLETRASINGVELGTDTIANMAWSFDELVAHAARGAWIAPGDVIGSGTTGAGCLMELWGRNQRHEPAPLAEGDEVVLTVEGIGTLTNRIGPPAPSPGALPAARPRRHPLPAA